MPFKMTYGQASNERLLLGLDELSKMRMNLKLSYAFKKIMDELSAWKEVIGRQYVDELLNVYVEKNEKGLPIFDEKMEGAKIIPEKRDEFLAKEKEFGAREITISRDKLSYSYILALEPNIKLSPLDLRAMEPIITDDMELPESLDTKPVA